MRSQEALAAPSNQFEQQVHTATKEEQNVMTKKSHIYKYPECGNAIECEQNKVHKN